jgi:methyl halide transferase
MKYIAIGKVPSSGRCLVPGCGRGYDVTALASPTRYVLGLDIVDTAIEAAKERLVSLSESMCACKENAIFETTSFFDMDGKDPENQFDFIYDYTFLCALDPSIRLDWSHKMAELVKPGGELLTLIFPILQDKKGGPPFEVSLSLVKDLLEPVGFECLELEMLPPELCHENRDGSGPNTPASGVGRWRKLF